jgi:hypothetical protein
MTKEVWGGLAEGEQVDLPNTFSSGRNINYRTKHDIVTLNQRLDSDTGAVTIDALPHWIADIQNTVYAYLQNGKVIERMAAGSWVSRKTVSASTGQGFGSDASFLYYANASFLGRFPSGASWTTQASDTFQNLAGGASWKPIAYFKNADLLAVGNGQNLAVYDYGAANFSATRLTVPRGYEIRDIQEWGDYLVLSVWAGTSLRQASSGRLILWDGFAEVANTIIDSAAGNAQITMSDNNKLNVWAGTSGEMFRLVNGQLNQERTIPWVSSQTGDFVEIYPGAKTEWNSIPHFGVAGDGSGASWMRGVYSYGSNRKNLPDSLNLEYTVSEDLNDNSIKVSALHASADDSLYVGWGNASAFAIDKLNTSAQYATGYFETLQYHGTPSEEGFKKTPAKLRVSTKPLVAGQSIVSKIKTDYSASFATILTYDTAGTVQENTSQLEAGKPIPTGRSWKERIELNSASGVAPEFISSKITYNTKPKS